MKRKQGAGMDTRFIMERTHYYSPAINIVLSVTIGGGTSEEELRTAIHKALEMHEIFDHKVILDYKGDSYYTPITRSILKIETRDSAADEEWKQIVHEQERIPFDFIHGELVRFFILKKIDTMQLIIVAHHLTGDGLAITYLLRDIMTALANPSLSFPKQPIQLITEGMLPKDVTLNPWIRFLAKQSNKSWRKNKKIFQYEEYLTMFHAFWRNRQVAIENHVISGVELKYLYEKCKEYNVTMNSAIVSAFSMAVKTDTKVGMAVSVRPQGYEGMGNYASGISIRFIPDDKKSFWENVRDVQIVIHKKLKNNRKKYLVLKFFSVIEATLLDAINFSAFASYDNKVATRFSKIFGYTGKFKEIGITNLTKLKIPVVYDKYSIDNLDFIAPLVPYTKRIIGVVTVGDTMSVTMQYEVKAGSENIKKDFEDAMHILCSGSHL